MDSAGQGAWRISPDKNIALVATAFVSDYFLCAVDFFLQRHETEAEKMLEQTIE